ncbi:MAG: DUF4097 family beta strand repeat protein [Chitinophagaceae bacterium]|nr:DUF4097 family beta strand repeat protein [Chitinophagaceae bacterium]
MKKSNKIIALIFGLLILIPALVVATILIRYRNGDFTRIEDERNEKSVSLTGIHHVILRGFANVNVYPSDSFFVQYTSFKGETEVRLNYNGDSVSITGDSTRSISEGNEQKQLYTQNANVFNIYIPSTSTLTAIKCTMKLNAPKPGSVSKELNLNLIASQLGSDDRYYSQPDFSLRNLNITADSAEVVLLKYCSIEQLNIGLRNESTLDASKAKTGLITFQADSSSTLQLSGPQLQRITQKK